MPFTRRQFIKRAGLVTAGSFLGPSLLRQPWVQQALAQTIGDRYFVVIFLDGGNDGLNTVTPVDDGSFGNLRAAYEVARSNSGSGGLRLSAADLGATTLGNDPGTQTPLALHPGLQGFKNLYDLGKLAVVQGVGYPDPNLSHDESRRKWETGVPVGSTGATGWVGRYLAANYGATEIPGVSVRNSVAGEFLQSQTSVLAVPRLNRFGFPHDRETSQTERAERDAAFVAVNTEAANSLNPLVRFAGNVASSTFTATQLYPGLHDDYVNDRPSWNSLYDENRTGMKRDLREVAKTIYGVSNGKVDSRFFEVRNGGYDTHGDQGGASGRHFDLHTEVADAVEIFYHDCADMGVADKLCLLVWSEFSRRIQQNDNGTDHGSQGPAFVIGGTVNGGIYGNHPDIDEGSLDNGNSVSSQAPGDPYRSTDLRDVYGTILNKWLGMPNPSSVLPTDSGDPNLYWTSPNFNMGFVP
jgi:uncharacterized protein (DUF1501 family)